MLCNDGAIDIGLFRGTIAPPESTRTHVIEIYSRLSEVKGWRPVTSLILSLVLAAQGADPEISQSQFLRIMNGLHSNVRDVSLVLEGELRFVGPSSYMNGKTDIIRDRHQVSYAYRNDNAALLEVYRRSGEDGSLFVHSKHALLKERLEEIEEVPDLRQGGNIRAGVGSPGSLNFTGSGHRFICYWYFASLSNGQDLNYKFLNWETVGDAKCLCVELVRNSGLPTDNQITYRLWIDIDRDGHPLIVESRKADQLMWRVHDIKLERFDSPKGRRQWLPVDCTYDSYLWGGKYESRPVFTERYHVVTSSVRFDQNLPDKMFSVRWKGTLPSSPGLKAIQRQFDDSSFSVKSRLRTDPAGVQQQLDRQLKEADRQNRMIEASTDASGISMWLQFAAVGSLILVTIVGFLKLRNGSSK